MLIGYRICLSEHTNLVSTCGNSSERKENMEVQTNRTLNGTLKHLLRRYGLNGGHANIDGINMILRSEPTNRQFVIPAADNAKLEVRFNNRELLSRFTALPIEYQAEVLACARKAMHTEQLIEIHLEPEGLSANKRTIKISQVLVPIGGKSIFGQGHLVISS
jgi:hypothetical protein